MFGFLEPGVSAAYHLVTGLVNVLAPVLGGLAAPAAIVACTIAVRLLLLPLTYYALRGQAAQARLQPELQELRRRYAGQPERLQRELAAFYQREGGGMLAGCLPLLAQLPFFSIMYRLFLSGSVGGHANMLLTHTLFGAPLGAHWLGAVGLVSGSGLVFLGLFALLAVACWAAARLARRAAPPAATRSAPARSVPAGGTAGRSAAAAVGSGPAAGQERIIGLLTRVLPYSTVVVAMFVPLAAGLYLLTTMSWTAAERAALGRRVQGAVAAKAVRAGTAAT
jgi:YidC/Oxa1 family membrane protein insertase